MSQKEIPELSVEQACARLAAGDCVFVDVRDPGSYASGHIPGAIHLGDRSVGDFLAGADRQRPVIVYCYHGHSSLGGADYLLRNGFREVYSMSGGFTAWAPGRPVETGSGDEEDE